MSADEETDEEDPEVAEPNDNQIKPVDDEDEVDDSESYNGNKDDSRVGKDEEEMNPYERLRASNIEERKRKMEKGVEELVFLAQAACVRIYDPTIVNL